MGEHFVIRRNGAFFRSGAAGYTNRVIEAGFYTAEEAEHYYDVEGVTIEPLSLYREEVECIIANAQRVLDVLSVRNAL